MIPMFLKMDASSTEMFTSVLVMQIKIGKNNPYTMIHPSNSKYLTDKPHDKILQVLLTLELMEKLKLEILNKLNQNKETNDKNRNVIYRGDK